MVATNPTWIQGLAPTCSRFPTAYKWGPSVRNRTNARSPTPPHSQRTQRGLERADGARQARAPQSAVRPPVAPAVLDRGRPLVRLPRARRRGRPRRPAADARGAGAGAAERGDDVEGRGD